MAKELMGWKCPGCGDRFMAKEELIITCPHCGEQWKNDPPEKEEKKNRRVEDITQHQGNKYIRMIRDVFDPSKTIRIDVYKVIIAFGVTDPGIQHAIKKLLTAGIRGKGSPIEDLWGAHAALHRAIQEQEIRDKYGIENYTFGGSSVQGLINFPPENRKSGPGAVVVPEGEQQIPTIDKESFLKP